MRSTARHTGVWRALVALVTMGFLFAGLPCSPGSGVAHADTAEVMAIPAKFRVFDTTSGRLAFQHSLPAGRGLAPVVMNSGLLVGERRRCLSRDRPYHPRDAQVVGIEPRTGVVRWRRDDVVLDTSLATVLTEPDQGPVLVRDPTSDQHPALRALDAQRGRELWSAPAGSQLLAADASVVVLLDEPLGPAPMFQDAPKRLRALDRRTGAELWQEDLGAVPTVVVGLGDDFAVVIAGRRDQDAVARVVDVATGQDRTTFPSRVPGFGPPSVAGESVATPTPFGGPTDVVDITTGQVRWPFPRTAFAFALADSFVTTSVVRPLSVALLDARSGATRWSRPAGDSYAGFLAAGDVLVLGTGDGLTRVAIASGRERWSLPYPRLAGEVDGVSVRTTSQAIDTERLVVASGCVLTAAD